MKFSFFATEIKHLYIAWASFRNDLCVYVCVCVCASLCVCDLPSPPVITVTLTPIGFPKTLNCSAIWKANSLKNKIKLAFNKSS